MKASGETKLLIILGAIVLLGAGVLLSMDKLMGSGSPLNGKPTPLPSVNVQGPVFDALVNGARHTKEDPGAQVTIVEFADFECGSCRRTYQGSLSELLDNPKRPVRFVFRHFPLDTEHQFAIPAGIAAEAADRQGKFWKMYQMLFTRTAEEPLDLDRIKESAKLAGLDMVQFEKDVADPALKKLVEDDKELAIKNQVNYTPTFLIRDKSGKITSAVGNDGLREAMDTVFGPDTAAPTGHGPDDGHDHGASPAAPAPVAPAPPGPGAKAP